RAGPAKDVRLVNAAGVAGVVTAGPTRAGRAVPGDFVPDVRRANHDRDPRAANGPPVGVPGGHVILDAVLNGLVQVILFNVGQDQDDPVGAEVLACGSWVGDGVDTGHLHLDGGRQRAVHVVIVVAGQGELLFVVAALDACGRLADLLDRRQQKADQN